MLNAEHDIFHPTPLTELLTVPPAPCSSNVTHKRIGKGRGSIPDSDTPVAIQASSRLFRPPASGGRTIDDGEGGTSPQFVTSPPGNKKSHIALAPIILPCQPHTSTHPDIPIPHPHHGKCHPKWAGKGRGSTLDSSTPVLLSTILLGSIGSSRQHRFFLCTIIGVLNMLGFQRSAWEDC